MSYFILPSLFSLNMPDTPNTSMPEYHTECVGNGIKENNR